MKQFLLKLFSIMGVFGLILIFLMQILEIISKTLKKIISKLSRENKPLTTKN